MRPLGITAIRWDGGALHLLDQRALPHEERWLTLITAGEVAEAIGRMVVRGAPAIGIAAAYGMVLAARAGRRAEGRARLAASRPTAVNLRWALERLDPLPDEVLEEEARRVHEEDLAINRAIGENGARVVRGPVLTICNTGALATGGWGTALGVVRSIREEGRPIEVFACETRPWLQGARLTAWECLREGIPCTLIADSAAAPLMASGRVGAVVVGADRVAANGDSANKIGTLALAVLARHYGLPFYVAAPTSTFDPRCPDGAAIPVEEREPTEILANAPEGARAWNPVFDVTPASLITGWITEEGVLARVALG